MAINVLAKKASIASIPTTSIATTRISATISSTLQFL